MLMTAVHMMDSSSTSPSPPPPWLPVLAVPGHHQLLHDLTPPASAAASSPAATPPPSSTNQQHLLLRRAVTKRRPRPSRRQSPTTTTTYISADPASFRRMVHQVTGADDLLLPLPHPADATETLARPAPVRADGGAGGFSFTGGPGGGAPLLPTLDTSAFLVDALSSSSSSRTTTGTDRDGPAAAPALEVEARRDLIGRACNNNAGGVGFYPTLESWDHHALS